MTSASGLILLIHMIAVLTIIVIAVKSIQRKDKYVSNQLKTSTPSKLVTFVKGLNTWRRLFGSLYFIHYLGLRFMVCILILVTPYVQSFILWGFIVFLQVVCTGMNVLRIYEKLVNYLLVLIWEVQILFTTVYLFSMHFKDQSSEDLKLKYLEPFVWTFTGFTLLFTVVNLINFLVIFIKAIIVLCKKIFKKKQKKKIIVPWFIFPKDIKETDGTSNVTRTVNDGTYIEFQPYPPKITIPHYIPNYVR